MNREYGRRLYVNGKYDMRTVTEFTMRNEFLYKDSEFKKPYRARNYAQMEYSFPTTHWNPPGFDMPANFGQGYSGLGSRMYYKFGCEGEKIGYTTLNMFNGESQELEIKGAKGFISYDWEVKGNGGTIFDLGNSWTTVDGQGRDNTNTYSPTNAKGDITIQLSRDGEVCDEITMFVGPEGGWDACLWKEQTGTIYIGGRGDGDNSSYTLTAEYAVLSTGYYKLRAFDIFGQVIHDLEYFYLNSGDCFGPYSWHCVNTNCSTSIHWIKICGGGDTGYWKCVDGTYPDL